MRKEYRHTLMPAHLDVSPVVKPIIERLINNMVYVEGGICERGISKIPVRVNDFWIGKFTLTNRERNAIFFDSEDWQDERYFDYDVGHTPFTKADGELFETDFDAIILKLNQLTGRNFRFLTASEWEYAARGGKYSKGYTYAGGDCLDEVAWTRVNSGIGIYNPVNDIPYEVHKIHEVGKKVPNELGLYDMFGNVWELCRINDRSISTTIRGGSVETKGLDGIYDRNGRLIDVIDNFGIEMDESNQIYIEDREIGFRLAHDVF